MEYKAGLAGLNVKRVDIRGASSLRRRVDCRALTGLAMCPACRLREDGGPRRNLLRKCQADAGPSPAHPENPPMKRGGG